MSDPYSEIEILAGLDSPERPFDEERYLAFCDKFFVADKFIDFLSKTLCTYPAINDFLIETLALANQKQKYFDT